jgi:3-oxoacyl-[acyl-carrier protein] reductase
MIGKIGKIGSSTQSPPSSARPLALVTGASRGIGRAIAIELAAHGMHVAVNYKSNEAAARETLATIEAAGGHAELCPFDVTDEPAVSTALSGLFAHHENIAALVNNAGVIADGLFAMMPSKDWRKVIDTSLMGFFNVTKPVIQKMIPVKKGSVVTISSVSGLVGNRGQANYAAAKAGLIGATRALASEVARIGIRVNVVAPGPIQTEMIKDMPADIVKKMIPMGRVGLPEEVARVVRFLCSEDASYITGQVLSVNGGMV